MNETILGRSSRIIRIAKTVVSIKTCIIYVNVNI